MRDEYKQLEFPAGRFASACPCCGAQPELWQYSEDPTDPTQKVVMCTTNEDVGPQDSTIFAGCPMYMPGNDFYQPTAREAINYWNAFAAALVTLRKRNGGE